MEKEVRARIQRATQEGRQLLEREFTEQLEGVYDIQMNGTVATAAGFHLAEDAQAQRARIKLVAAVAHHRAQGLSAADAVAALRRECAFTTFNRFVALKMLEAREIVLECVSRGMESKGFKEFLGLAPGLAGSPESAWRLYLECVFDEIGREVRVLFDRRDPASLLWPRRAALDALLAILNATELGPVWVEDETIGWVYQYFNGDDERKQMRAESQAPRNSRELAVRNQFFTPRYVVEFLTDNTLGQTWLEMRRGETRLLEDCRHLVRRPKTIFLGEGEAAPDSSPEHLLFRAKKDPRDIKVLDPASGSGHFLLYAFELFLCMYEEAWADATSPVSEATGHDLRSDYPTIDALRSELPGVVLRHNLFGVDIDPRAAQIAALALWMRAQRAWGALGVRRADRPLVTRTNIVVAEPMPGERDLLDEFCRGLDLAVGEMVRKVFDDMALAGEAGTLLRIEQTVRSELETRLSRGGMFAAQDPGRWAEVERKVYSALREYSDGVPGGAGYRRRLFADDAGRGFAFIDVCRGRYDVVLMNPPFGRPTSVSAQYLYDSVPSSRKDLLAAFIERSCQDLCPTGRVGALTGRLALFKDSLEDWRRRFMLGGLTALEVVADLGWNVLDGATVEAAAYIVANTKRTTALAIDLTSATDKQGALLAAARKGPHVGFPLAAFDHLPGSPISYFAEPALLKLFASRTTLADAGMIAEFGIETGDDFRYLRLAWEPAPRDLRSLERWTFVAKGGDYNPWVCDLHLVFDARRLALMRRASNQEVYGAPGVTWTERTSSNPSFRVLPGGAVPSRMGPVALFKNSDLPLGGLALFLNAAPSIAALEVLVGGGDKSAGAAAAHYLPAYPSALPAPDAPFWSEADRLFRLIYKAVSRERCDETHSRFVTVDIDQTVAAAADVEAVDTLVGAWAQAQDLAALELGLCQSEVDGLANSVGQITARVPHGRGTKSTDKLSWSVHRQREETLWAGGSPDIDGSATAFASVSWAMGVAMGRFDVRFATGERPSPPDPDPFDALPACSPGMLTGPNGLPVATPPLGYPIPFPTDGILVDDPGHACDLLARLRQVFTVVFPEASDERLREASAILDPGATDLRPWLRRSYFAEHIQRYSKSRRKAPIYWRLGPASGSYSIWIYLHRFAKDTLHRILNDHAIPKLRFEENRLAALLAEAPTPTPSQRKAISEQEALVDDLRGFQDEVARLTPLWDPDLDDGVILNAAPLYRLFGHTKPWQNECESAWESLCAGEYDWSHLAIRLWPERVVPKCVEERSLAVAHGLEHLLWEERDDGKWAPREGVAAELAGLIADRTSLSVKAALLSLERSGAAVASKRPRPARAAAPREPRAPRQLSLPTAEAAPDGPVLDTLRAAFHQFPEPASRAELLAASGIEEASWKGAIDVLIARGEVEKAGQARGTRYSLVHRPAPQS